MNGRDGRIKQCATRETTKAFAKRLNVIRVTIPIGSITSTDLDVIEGAILTEYLEEKASVDPNGILYHALRFAALVSAILRRDDCDIAEADEWHKRTTDMSPDEVCHYWQRGWTDACAAAVNVGLVERVSNNCYRLTNLGARVVEALPDAVKVAEILGRPLRRAWRKKLTRAA